MAAYAVGVVTPMDSSKSATMTCQVYAGNARVWAYSCPYLTPFITSFSGFPSPGSRRYTQVRANRKSRHFGRDAEIQAMDGNWMVVQVLVQMACQALFSRSWMQGHLLWPTVCHPWTLDFGIHAEMTGLQHLCITTSTPARERYNSRSGSGNGFIVARQPECRAFAKETHPTYTLR